LIASPKKISFAGPSVTDHEVKTVTDAVLNGFYENYTKHTLLLEEKIRNYLGVKHVIATHCCTVALHAAAVALDLGPGDEVIIPDISWVATAYAVAYTGATCVFVDIDPNTWCIHPEAIEQAITSKTKAIMLVHTFGHPADMDSIMRIAKAYNLSVIEDAAPSLGSRYKGQLVGTQGDISCFSFQGAKLTVSGEGGIICTNNSSLYEKLKLICSMGRTDSNAVFWSDQIGYQYTIANLTAAMALAQVERIDELLDIKKRIYLRYLEGLSGLSSYFKLLSSASDCESNYCYPSLMLADSVKVSRDEILLYLKKLNVHARPAFPRMSQFPVFQERFSNPVATKVALKGISLPAAANLSSSDIDFVCQCLKSIVS